jgi:hypothetical protein
MHDGDDERALARKVRGDLARHPIECLANLVGRAELAGAAPNVVDLGVS